MLIKQPNTRVRLNVKLFPEVLSLEGHLAKLVGHVWLARLLVREFSYTFYSPLELDSRIHSMKYENNCIIMLVNHQFIGNMSEMSQTRESSHQTKRQRENLDLNLYIVAVKIRVITVVIMSIICC